MSTFVTEANSGHDILKLYIRKIFWPYEENVHCDKFCQLSKLMDTLGRILDIVANNKGGWLTKTLSLNGDIV